MKHFIIFHKRDDFLDPNANKSINSTRFHEYPCNAFNAIADSTHYDSREAEIQGNNEVLTDKELSVQLHFFEIPKPKFSILDTLSDMFSLNSNRVAAVRLCRNENCRIENCQNACSPRNKEATFDECNTKFLDAIKDDNNDISLQSKFSIDQNNFYDLNFLQKSFKHHEGIYNVQLLVRNDSTIHFEVEHNPSVVSVDDLIYHFKRFNLTTRASLYDRQATESQSQGTVGRSKFFVSNICCASEIAMINQIIQPTPGVNKVLINVPAKCVYVDHDYLVTSANDIVYALNKNKFGAQIQENADAIFRYSARKSQHVIKSTMLMLEKGSNQNVILHFNSASTFMDYNPKSVSLFDVKEKDPRKKNEKKMTKSNSNKGQSSIFVENICCASEVPAIQAIISPISGVKDIRIDVPTKTVYVDHDMLLVSGEDIAKALNDEDFGATVKKDASKSLELDEAVVNSKVGRSSFFVENICCASEVPAIQAIISPISGVKDIRINVPTKTVYVDHDMLLVSGEDIAKALNDEDFGATVKKDASKILDTRVPHQSTKFVESTFVVKHFNANLDFSIVEDVLSKFSNKQVRSYLIHPTWGTIKIDHNPEFLTASDLKIYMERTGLSAEMIIDGKQDGLWTIPLNDSVDEKIETYSAKVNPMILLCGLLWIISMLSFFGEDW